MFDEITSVLYNMITKKLGIFQVKINKNIMLLSFQDSKMDF